MRRQKLERDEPVEFSILCFVITTMPPSPSFSMILFTPLDKNVIGFEY
jgi:hypothetical protein